MAGSNPSGWALPWGSVTNRQWEGRAKADKPAAISCIAWQCFLFNLQGSANWKISSGRDCCQALTSPADDALAAAAAQDRAAQETDAGLQREHLSSSGVLKQVALRWGIVWSCSPCWSWGIITARWSTVFFTLAFRELLLSSCCSDDGLDTGLVWTTPVSIYKLALELVFQSEIVNSRQELLGETIQAALRGRPGSMILVFKSIWFFTSALQCFSSNWRDPKQLSSFRNEILMMESWSKKRASD